ncbi:MAG: protein kinase [candidate division Zixibacteria bacterium]|nr:protein kinase [candidate division Zixibacteria bacterium]NIV08343.1 protein kinase [candidate division Zixibacteria bacterium]
MSQQLVDLYLSGSCSEDEIHEIEAHLTQCESCRKQVESSRSTIASYNQSDLTRTIDTTAAFEDCDKTRTYIREDEDSTKLISQVPTSHDTSRTSTAPLDSMFEGYDIHEQLPVGGQAVVYKATQKATKRTVALKVLLQGPHASMRAQYRFEREVDLAANLQHPNIVTIYDSGIAKGQYYFAMQYVEGKPLDEYVESEKLSVRSIMVLFEKVCSGVAYAHQRGVMHRDLKPGNILVDADGEPHILDFGLAKLTDGSEQTSPEMAMTSIPGKVIGTLAYMSPEQASAQPDKIDVRTDVYSIGIILYRILTDCFPYDVSGSMLAILRTIQEAEPTRPSKIKSRLNSEVEAILLKSLDKDPAHRYQSAAHLQQDIGYWLKGMPISARADSSIYLLRKIITRHYYTSAVVALLLVILFGFSCFVYQLYGKLRDNNIKLISANKSLVEQAMQLSSLALNVSFSDFLRAFQAEPGQSQYPPQYFVRYFTGQKREMKAAIFLLDKRPLAEKVTEFRQELTTNEPLFTEYIIAEHYLKDGNRDEALKAYRKCLSYDLHLEKNRWLAMQVKSRLYELTHEDTQEKTSSKVED